ncbi:head-to-tail stopper [Mycobacterium phage MalagasyRose]|uniref:Head-to-tail stopper n=1 Tax=Mycobacterium phage MalagasyRose TaxID=2599870 RepID=A0A5J6TDF7_9CAUD|nr:head-to-tail stopper [Mycobacterium phage MalagasyRose]QFG08866.1 head-to-tail stopper [Mycobacterium phage MalagasyRose]
MRARYWIGVASYTPGGVDDDGYSTPAGHGPIRPIRVFGWQPLASDMPTGAELTRRIITSKLVLVPDVSLWTPSDHVWLAGAVDDPEEPTVFTPTDLGDFYRVSEDVRDYNTGPFGYRPGGAVVIESAKG